MSPVNVIDAEQGLVYESSIWELVKPRLSVENIQTREIGSANVYTAYNLLYKANINKSINVQELFLSTLYALVEQKLIRKKPEHIRQGFKIVE